MVQTIQAEHITLEQLITLYGLQLVEDEQFFREWQDELPELTDLEKQQPVFGMITSGGSFIFIKLVTGNPPQYATSDIFDIRNRENELYSVLSILKSLSQVAE